MRHAPALVLGALAAAALHACSSPPTATRLASGPPLSISWAKRILTIRADALPGGAVEVLYLEAYCRPGSTDRDWRETVIPHTTRLVAASDDGKTIELEDTLRDGVVVRHVITAGDGAVDFQLTAHNPSESASDAHWAQPCMRVATFTDCSTEDARALVPAYARRSFVFVDGELAPLPTEPWATDARYTPGQVYCPVHVDRDDVNPRPLSPLVPSNGLIGCRSADGALLLATAWEPYQELFVGVLSCLHSDFRVGGLQPGETKAIRGKIYVTGDGVDALLARYRADFPEHR